VQLFTYVLAVHTGIYVTAVIIYLFCWGALSAIVIRGLECCTIMHAHASIASAIQSIAITTCMDVIVGWAYL
jgi:hypothetical protein